MCINISIMIVLGIVFMNASLITLPIPLFTLLKLTTIPTIALLQYILHQKTITSPLARMSLILILTGVGLGTYDSSSSTSTQKASASTNKGLLYGLFGILFTSHSQLSLQHSKTLSHAQGLQTVALISPYAFLIAFVCALFVDDAPTILTSFVLHNLHSASSSATAWIAPITSSLPWKALLASCLISISTNLFGFALIQTVSHGT